MNIDFKEYNLESRTCLNYEHTRDKVPCQISETRETNISKDIKISPFYDFLLGSTQSYMRIKTIQQYSILLSRV